METSWLANPLTNEMAEPLALLLLALFGVAALALLVQQQVRALFSHDGSVTITRLPSEKVLWQRYFTWMIIALLFTSALLSGPLAIALLCAFLCWKGGQEYADLTGIPAMHSVAVILAGWVTIAATLVLSPAVLAFAPALAFFACAALLLQPVEDEIDTRFRAGLHSFWGYLYLGWLPAYLLALSMSKMPGLLLVVGLGVAISDVGAFCVGKLLGGPKMAPRLSPNKTWSGALGSLLGAALALALVGFALPAIPLWQRAILVLVIGAGSIWGDLLESLLKRQRGVKDAGTMLPGFGGLLDRIDSLLLVAPLVYYVALFLFR